MYKPPLWASNSWGIFDRTPTFKQPPLVSNPVACKQGEINRIIFGDPHLQPPPRSNPWQQCMSSTHKQRVLIVGEGVYNILTPDSVCALDSSGSLFPWASSLRLIGRYIPHEKKELTMRSPQVRLCRKKNDPASPIMAMKKLKKEEMMNRNQVSRPQSRVFFTLVFFHLGHSRFFLVVFICAMATTTIMFQSTSCCFFLSVASVTRHLWDVVQTPFRCVQLFPFFPPMICSVLLACRISWSCFSHSPFFCLNRRFSLSAYPTNSQLGTPFFYFFGVSSKHREVWCYYEYHRWVKVCLQM